MSEMNCDLVAPNSAPACPSLVLGISGHVHNSSAEDADETFCRVRYSVFLRDGGVCQGCQTKTVKPVKTVGGTFRGMGRFEVHHIDDDYHNNDPSNLILLCPFCHNVFHCGAAHGHGAGTIIEAPWISQADLNALSHALFGVMILDSFSSKEKKENWIDSRLDSPASVKDLEILDRISQIARNQYESLLRLSAGIESRFGAGTSDPAVFGKALAQLHKEDPARYAQRAQFLGGARFLPSYFYFSTQPTFSKWAMSDIEYWQSLLPLNNSLSFRRFLDEWMRREEAAC